MMIRGLHEVHLASTDEVLARFEGEVPRVGDYVWLSDGPELQQTSVLRVVSVCWWIANAAPAHAAKACVYVERMPKTRKRKATRTRRK